MATETRRQPWVSRRSFLTTAGSVLASRAARGLVRPADASTAWGMRGDAFEACSCNVTCPCNFASDPTLGFCFGTVNGEHRVTVPGLLEVGTERIPNPLPGQPPLDINVSNITVAGLYAGPGPTEQYPQADGPAPAL